MKSSVDRLKIWTRRLALPLGLVLLVLFGPLGWLKESTWMGLLAGMGFMLLLVTLIVAWATRT